jgi:hypothetical protein
MKKTTGELLEELTQLTQEFGGYKELEPLPPEILVDALQDKVHTEEGKSRPVKSVKVKTNPNEFIICPDCDGEGVIDVDDSILPPGFGVWRDCERCRGEGFVRNEEKK